MREGEGDEFAPGISLRILRGKSTDRNPIPLPCNLSASPALEVSGRQLAKRAWRMAECFFHERPKERNNNEENCLVFVGTFDDG